MRRILYFLVLLALCSSCKALVEPSVVNNTISLRVEADMPDLDEGSETKANASYIVKLTWSAGDVIDVYKAASMVHCGTITALSSGASTSFIGDIQNVSPSDQLLFVYSKGLETNISDGHLSFDFRNQSGLRSDLTPIVCTAVSNLTQEQINDSEAVIKPTFSFQMAFVLATMSNLPASKSIENVGIYNMPYELDIHYDASKGKITYESGPLAEIDEDDGEVYIPEGPIELSPGNSISPKGTIALYFAVPNSPRDTRLTRDIYLIAEGREYHDVISQANLAAGGSYVLILSQFTDEDNQVDPIPIHIDATMPQLSSEDGTAAPIREWKAGDEVTLVNLTKNLVLWPNLVAEKSGTVTTLSAEITVEEGFDPDDELLLVYPAIETDCCDSFSECPIEIDLSTQSGTIDGIPYVMTATSTLRDNLSATLAEFEYQVAVNAIEMNGMFDDFMTVDEEDVEEDVTDYDIPIWQIKIASYDGEEIPTALVISYDANDGYRISTEETSDCFRLTEEYIVPLSNDNLKVYFVSPGSNGGSLSFDVSTNIYAPSSVYYLENIDKSEFYYSKDPIQIVPVTGHLKANTAGQIESGGVDLSEVEEGGEEDDI